MPTTDIIVTAPLPPFLYDPLRADYRCHDYVQAADKPALLAAQGKAIRGLVQGGGTVTPTTLLDALPALEIISVFGVGYDGVPVDYCRKRGLKVTNTPDVLTEDVADVAVALVMMTGRGFVRLNRFAQAGEWKKRGPELTTKLAGKTVGILGIGPHRQGDRRARIGDGHEDRLYRTQAAGSRVSIRRGLEDARGGIGLSRRCLPGRSGDEEHGRRRRARRARKERHHRQHRARLDHRRAGARRRASGGNDQGRGARRIRRRAQHPRTRYSRWTTSSCCRTSAARRGRRGRRWAISARRISTRGSPGSHCRR